MSPIDTSGFVEVEGFDFPLFASPGAEVRAREIGERAERALEWLAAILGPRPRPLSFVVGAQAWAQVAEVPIYGLPHVDRLDDGVAGDLGWKMVMGDEPGDFWLEVYDFVSRHLPDGDRERLRAVYGDARGFAARFPDLIVVHELAHLFQGYRDGAAPNRSEWRRSFPRAWVSELFANLALYGYLADIEPAELPALEAICVGAHHVPAAETPVRALDDMYRSFEYPNGAVLYCWYQFVIIMGAKDIWQGSGRDGLAAFSRTLDRPEMSDDEIFEALGAVDRAALRFARDWPV